MIKVMVPILILFGTLMSSANAERLKGGYPACVSESLFDQFTSALVKKDKLGVQYLMKHGCIITKSGIQVSVLDTTWSGKAKVRAYVGDNAVVLWTNIENIKN